MSSDPNATALAQALELLDEAARSAKRQEAANRRQAQELRRAQARIRACLEVGSDLSIEQPHRPGGQSDGRKDP